MVITTDQAFSGGQSGYIGDDGVQDAMLLLGNQTSGTYTLDWYMYIPGGKTGYYNVQEDEDTGATGGIWAINVHFNLDNLTPGTGYVVDDANPANIVSTFSYPENFWFQISHVINLDTDTVVMSIDGTEIYNGPFYSGGNLGGIDFFSIDANNQYYIDDVVFSSAAGVEDFSADSFRVYPNPVKDVLNISTKTAVDNIEVYDVLGKRVLSVQPDVISPKINMSGLASGAYMVKVTIGNASKTVKIIK
ncbi:T9SS type A sorting domain-containing protein [Aequorivita soesokkakensis]|nr:T9SS type A sorting domain-containing protein [Aequorivita soesokkakensis]